MQLQRQTCFHYFDPVLYKIDIIIIKECSLTIHTNIAKELVFYSMIYNLPPPAV